MSPLIRRFIASVLGLSAVLSSLAAAAGPVARPGGGGAGSAGDDIHGFWIIASESDFPPYNYNRKGVRVGIDVEIVEAVLARLGAQAIHKTMPFTDLLRALDGNRVDLAFQLVATPERLKAYNLVGPIRTGTTVLMVRQGETAQYPSVASLAGKSIGVVEGFRYVPEFDESNQILKVPGTSTLTSLRRLDNGRLDAVIGDLQVLNHHAWADGLAKRVRVVAPPLAQVPRYVALPLARTEKAAAFREAFAALKTEGAIDVILKRHADPPKDGSER